MRPVEYKQCSTCGVSFGCGGNCWCNKYPPIMPVTNEVGCLCEACLHQKMVETIKDVMGNLSLEMEKKIKALPPQKELLKDIDYVINDHGDKVFTAWYKLRNG